MRNITLLLETSDQNQKEFVKIEESGSDEQKVVELASDLQYQQ